MRMVDVGTDLRKQHWGGRGQDKAGERENSVFSTGYCCGPSMFSGSLNCPPGDRRPRLLLWFSCPNHWGWPPVVSTPCLWSAPSEPGILMQAGVETGVLELGHWQHAPTCPPRLHGSHRRGQCWDSRHNYSSISSSPCLPKLPCPPALCISVALPLMPVSYCCTTVLYLCVRLLHQNGSGDGAPASTVFDT